ncbi:high affinity cGMP-specific 3',5'-cyclic phosphodiesterase 9A-like isoform X1 [Styela clava]
MAQNPNLEKGETSTHSWMVAKLPPTEPFSTDSKLVNGGLVENSDVIVEKQQGESVEGLNSEATIEQGSREEKKGKDEAEVDAINHTLEPKKTNSEREEQVSTNTTTTKVELIGHLEKENKTAVDDFSTEKSNKGTYNRKGNRRQKSRHNGEKIRGRNVETLSQSEEGNISDKMKININDQDPLLHDDRIDQEEEEDYGSDDTASSISSIGDDTMPGMEDVSYPDESMHRLSEPDFDVWRLGRDAMVDHLEYMYHELGVTRAWKIPRATLRMFLLGVRERYQDNPYHNFKHCFCVTQMTYSMICKLKLRHLLSVDDLGMILTGAVCHDVDHPGLNNGYHCHAHSPLAILYNYQSILEQHHFAVTCRILTNKERNIFRNVSNRDEILNGTRELILATDLALHKDIMEQFKRNTAEGFDFKNRSHVLSLLKIIIKCADVSNEVRPENIATPWVERLFSEYYEQSAREKRERLPVTPYMDPEKVDVTDSQEGFIKGMMLPMYSELAKLVVDARIYYVNPLSDALLRYELQKRQTM